jgi:hypothetical protein
MASTMDREQVSAHALTEEESRALLRTARGTGHIALSVRALPVVIPVAFTIDDDTVVVSGGALDRLSPPHVGDVMAFQADGSDARGPWSVLVRGRVEIDSISQHLAVRIPAELVEGHRF